MHKEPANKNRFLVEALRRIAVERDIGFSSFSHDWIIQLYSKGLTRSVYGYNFDLNPAASALIANDKSALSSILTHNSIPNVEHTLFLAPDLSEYIGSGGNWGPALQYTERTAYPLVCKTNQGTAGDRVFKVNNPIELETAFQNIHASAGSIALSPYYRIDAEYRVIFLKGSALLCFEKQRPFVKGDGRSTFFELLKANYPKNPELMQAALTDPCIPLDAIPDRDSTIPIIWKHNLGQGARPLFLLDSETRQTVSELAARACVAAGMQFASVDVIRTDNQMKIMEVNAGIMMENLSRFSSEARKLAFDIYARAVDAMFDPENSR